MHNSGSNFMKSGFISIVPEVTTPLVCLMPVIIIGVSIPILQSSCLKKKKNESILFFCPPRAPWALCIMLAVLGWSSLSHTCLPYLPYCSELKSRAVCLHLLPVLRATFSVESTNQWDDWGNEHRDNNCSWQLSAHVWLHSLLDIAVPFFMLNCW